MLIEIHMIQNHSPANLNRDDLGAPKTCYFGGVLRSRISSQCIKRSIRLSSDFKCLLGGIRTRRLAELIQGKLEGKDVLKRAKDVLSKCGIAHKEGKGSDMLVYTTWAAVDEMARLLSAGMDRDITELADSFGMLIEDNTKSPDMALCGRMLETGSSNLKNTTVEAALQVAHAISTHEARPEIDYYVAVDDVPGTDAGAGFVDEAMYASACFYKYFSINWEQLLNNLKGDAELAAHTIGAFILAAAKTNPSGKQNSFAAHNYPDGILVEIKQTPTSYANAFAKPVTPLEDADVVACSIGQLANYAYDLKIGYFDSDSHSKAFWFSPNMLYDLHPNEGSLNAENHPSLNGLIEAILKYQGFDWKKVKQVRIREEG
jgi:CRISPR system Cascade subunit CasC